MTISEQKITGNQCAVSAKILSRLLLINWEVWQHYYPPILSYELSVSQLEHWVWIWHWYQPEKLNCNTLEFVTLLTHKFWTWIAVRLLQNRITFEHKIKWNWNYVCTVWKFQIFFVTDFYVKSFLEILDIPKLYSLIFAIVWGYEFCWFGKFQPWKRVKLYKYKNSEPLNM